MKRGALWLLVVRLGAQEIQIQKEIFWEPGTARPIPIALTGFEGEAAAVLQFDLEVAGFRITAPDSAQYELKGGRTGAGLEGSLLDRIARVALFARAYNGGTLRQQAHALADDVVLAVTGRRGIAQTRIAFKVERGGTSEIYVSDYDGFGARPVTQDQSLVAAPCWVPGQSVLYYTSYKGGNPDILRHDLTTGRRQIVAAHPGLNTSAAVSPDGTRLAMILSKDGATELYVARADGTGLQRLTFSREDESSPTWSADGQWICFATRQNGRRLLARLPASGGTLQRMQTTGVSNPSEPDWSPDGKWIAFTAQMGGFEICVVPADGGSATVLVSGEDPSWAPNSRTIVFTRRQGDRRVLSLLDVATRQVKDVARVSGNSSQPTWAR
ncbi:MAG: LpqB family beta-propeller domain-containing protein [Verrucomicrobiota bacterium]|nr:LpqB family beta-propeller domain-containing protein [Limisphaera sp.]MDW8382536.1 LpqB family beta-propeller domain-containing protein [Verrucomicrobiota bacterium]